MFSKENLSFWRKLISDIHESRQKNTPDKHKQDKKFFRSGVFMQRICGY